MSDTVDIVVAALLFRESQVLLCHRTPMRQWFPNVWDLPGGHVERDESLHAALARELHEELGIQIDTIDLPAEPDVVVADDNLTLSIWSVPTWKGEPTNCAPEEHDSIGWFDVDEIGSMPLALVGYPAMISSLHRAARL